MGIFSRMFGICRTPRLRNSGAWRLEGDVLALDLARAAKLIRTGSAVRLEDEGLPERVLVVHGHDDGWYAFKNRCSHRGRRIDPLPDRPRIECCSVGKSTWDYDGNLLSGSAKDDVSRYPTRRDGSTLYITLE